MIFILLKQYRILYWNSKVHYFDLYYYILAFTLNNFAIKRTFHYNHSFSFIRQLYSHLHFRVCQPIARLPEYAKNFVFIPKTCTPRHVKRALKRRSISFRFYKKIVFYIRFLIKWCTEMTRKSHQTLEQYVFLIFLIFR